MDVKSERGAVIVEATLSLTVFMFAILTIYTMLHVSMAQARIGAALNATAKEISQYSYLYELSGLNQKQANISQGGGAAETILSDNFAEVNNLYEGFAGLAGTTISMASSPDNIESFGAFLLSEGIDQVKGYAVGEIARQCMKKHFGSDPDGYLKALGVEDGMNGLSFWKTRIFSGGQSEDILLDVRYQVTVVKLLNIDMKLNFELCAKTRAWVGED